MMERLMTSQDLSDILGVPPRTLDQWAYLKQGPPFLKVGRHRRYRSVDVEAWIAAQVSTSSDARKKNR